MSSDHSLPSGSGEDSDRKVRAYKAAKTAFQAGDLETASQACRRYWNTETSFVSEAVLDPAAPPSGVSCDAIELPTGDIATKVRFEEALVYLGVNVPISLEGVAYTKPFATHLYPKRYIELYHPDASEMLSGLAQRPAQVQHAYSVSLVGIYYHFIFDTLPHLFAMKSDDQPLPALVLEQARYQSDWQKDVLKYAIPRFGLSNFNLAPSPGTVIKAKQLQTMVPLPIDARIRVLRTLVDRAEGKSVGSYIYTQRAPSDRRQLRNEAAILEALGPRFSVVRPDQMDFATQIEVFSNAKCIVGPHGSNLTNIVFASEGTAVVELYVGQEQPMYENISRFGGMSYRRLKGQPVDGMEDQPQDHHHDYLVDPDVVRTAVDELLD